MCFLEGEYLNRLVAQFAAAFRDWELERYSVLPEPRDPLGRLNDLLVGSGNKSSARVVSPQRAARFQRWTTQTSRLARLSLQEGGPCRTIWNRAGTCGLHFD